MSDTVLGPEELLAQDARQRELPAEVIAPEASSIELPSARRTVSLRPYYALLVAAIVAPTILFGLVAWQYRTYMLRNAVYEVGRTVELTTHQAHDLLQLHQNLVERVDDYIRGMSWDEIGHSEQVFGYLTKLKNENPQVGNIFLLDSSGNTRLSSVVFPERPLMLADRDYFQELRAADVGTALGKMTMGRSVARLTFNVARRRSGSTGSFDGVIVISAAQSFFAEFWQSLVPQAGAQFGLYGNDGRILARLPPVPDEAHATLDPTGPLMTAAREAQRGSFESVSLIDGVDRFTAFQQVPDFNVFVAHGISRTSVIDAWRSQILIMAAFFAVATAALAGLALLALRRARQEQYAFAEWEHTARSLHEEEAKTLDLNRDLRRRAAELEASNAELETFSYSVSHDLRTPLRAIDGYSAMLLQDYTAKLDEEGKRQLVVVRQATTKMGRLIDDILDFSRTGRLPMNMMNVDMTEQVQGLIDEAQARLVDRRVRFEVATLPSAWADPSLIRRVWFNLIDNAIKFTASKPSAVITIGGRQTEKEIIYSVVDNGIGFDRQYVGMLFGVGHRLVGVEYEGCGVGLAIIKRIVERHKGRVWADGIPNEGATFYFALPTQQPDH